MDWMALLPFGLGLIQKHVIRRLPNDVIPYVNTAVSIATVGFMTGDWGEAVKVGAAASGIATVGHQMIKMPIRYKTGISL
jgi:hypothetical protein